MAVHADQGDAPQGAVGVAIAAAVQSMPVGAAGGHRDRRDAAQACERTLRAQSAGIVASRDQQLPGGVYSDAGQGNQLGRDCGDQRREVNRGPLRRSTALVADAGSVSGPGRRAAQARMRWRGFSLRSGARTGSGAETMMASICAPAWIRAFSIPRQRHRTHW